MNQAQQTAVVIKGLPGIKAESVRTDIRAVIHGTEGILLVIFGVTGVESCAVAEVIVEAGHKVVGVLWSPASGITIGAVLNAVEKSGRGSGWKQSIAGCGGSTSRIERRV